MNFPFIICFLITLNIITTKVLAQQSDIYCYGTDRYRPQTAHFATKTLFVRVKGADPEYERQFDVSECKPQKIWYLSRHGTRYPTIDDIVKRVPEILSLHERIVENSNQKRTILCPEDRHLFRTWKLNKNVTEAMASILIHNAKQEIKLMAKKHKKILGKVLPNHYDSKYYKFGHTEQERTASSWRAFAEGLFDTTKLDDIPTEVPQTLLAPFEACEDWKEYNKDLFNENSEMRKFDKSDVMLRTIDEISKRLGFTGGLELSEVNLMWEMCRYEEAWNPEKSSAWCAAFTTSNVEVLEYAQDLLYYHKFGYGAPKKYETLPCHAIKDMITQLNDSNTDPHASFYFAHSSILQLVIRSMGFYKDSVPLTSTNMNAMKHRKWQVSKLSPFTANFVAVRFDCQDEPKVMFFLNYKPIIELDWCSVGLCKWSEVMTKYAEFANHNCDDYFCHGSSSSTIKLSLSLLLISCIYYFITLNF